MRRVSSFLLRLTIIGVLLHVYIGFRLLPELAAPAARYAGALWLVGSCLLIPLGMLSRVFERQPLGDRVAWAGLLAMGFFSSLLVLTLARDVLLASLVTVDALAPGAVSLAQWRIQTAAGVPLAALAVSVVGFVNARRRARVVDVAVPIDDLPAALDGFTIVQISDIHVGPTIKRGYVEAIVDAVNRLAPDLVAVTGDVVDGTVAQLAGHAAPLGRLRARHGAFVVTGNHEYYSGADEWIAEFRRLGLDVLLNEHRTLDHGDGRLVIAGVTDYSAGHFDPAHRSDPSAALAGAPADVRIRVLLAHQPRSATAAADAGFTLQLSGHTHGGQFFPWNFFVRLQQPFTAGLARLNGLWVYTSRGTGYWGPPKRLGAPSEITRVRLVRGEGNRTRAPASVTPNAERRTPNAERRTPNAERRTPNAERRTPNAEHRTPNTEHRTPNTEHRTPSAERHRERMRDSNSSARLHMRRRAALTFRRRTPRSHASAAARSRSRRTLRETHPAPRPRIHRRRAG
ncbi:Ser/Thr protein phosphatase [Burkholderia pseudomallei]|nr:Ser/Thr protein phosphatase [Burkholderia pseudomallei]